MLFALPVYLTLSLCLSSIYGNEVTEKYTEAISSHLSSTASRPLTQRNQTKVTRDDQLLSVLAARRRQIIQNRFKSHIKNIVDISTTGVTPNTSIIPNRLRTPINSTRTINVHINLSNLIHSPVANTTNEQSNSISKPSTESNVVNVSSPRSIYKVRKNVFGNGEPPKIQENKTSSKSSNMPIIRNILFRRKMSFLNRKLPIDFDPIAFDPLSISEINKHGDLILDSEDSLQVEESSHDKLIYYDVKNNASKKSVNNFEDTSDEMKSISMINKTFHQNKHKSDNVSIKENVSTTANPVLELKISSIESTPTSNKPNLDEVVVVFNNTENLTNLTIEKNKYSDNTTKTHDKQNKTDLKTNKNNTRFMSPSLYSYFRPLDVPEEEMQPFLRFGEKLPNNKQNLPRNQSSKTTTLKEKEIPFTEENNRTIKNEEEIDENMDVSVTKPIYENKITKTNLSNTKVNIAREYFKNRVQSKNGNKNVTESNSVAKPEKKVQIYNMQQLRNMTRNRGFRNTTIFQHKRNGLRQTINLKPNSTLATLKPTTLPENNETRQDSPISKSTTTLIPDTNLNKNETEEILTGTVNKKTVEDNVQSSKNLDVTESVTQTHITRIKNNQIKTTSPTYYSQDATTKLPKTHIDNLNTLSAAQTSILTTILSTTTETSQTTTESIKSTTGTLTTTTTHGTKITTMLQPENKTEEATAQLSEMTEVSESEMKTELPATEISDLDTSVPTRIYSTAVATSVSIGASKLKPMNGNKSENGLNTTDIIDPEATVVAALSNFTSQAFQSHTKYDTNSTRNPATMYPNISIEIPNSRIHHHVLSSEDTKKNLSKIAVSETNENEQKFSPTDFIIHVPDIEIPTTEFPIETTVTVNNNDKTSKFNDTVTTTSENVESTTQSQKYYDAKIKERISYLEDIAEKEIGSPSPINITTITTSSKPNVTTYQTETHMYNPTTTEHTDENITLNNKMINVTISNKPDAESELSILTLFGKPDLRKPDIQNFTNLFKTETVISRRNESSLTFDNVHAAYILTALGFLPMMVIVIYVVRTLMKRRNKMIEDFEAELHNSEKKTIINPVTRLPTLLLDTSNRWEFPRSKLRLQTLLGEGNFGQVWKAEADDLKGHIGLTRLVAVKTIKDGAGTKERDDLLKELAIMQKMGSHPNVVTLLGCCTDKEPYLLIMEYVMYGKLLTYLRDHRTRRDYYNFSDDAATLTARDLTVFAYCVARGMEYLSSKGIIHRDLAARNVLVDHNKLCKIADFGMSRDAPTGEVTEPRQQKNALPVRWMAVESLLYSLFTHKTDVWSFGILLWEIVTLGSSPYANMYGREVMRLVCDGYRLERPNHCKPELYRVMARTWHVDPNQRPTFTELRSELAEMLENTNAEGSYVDLESFRADSTVYEIDNCTPRGNYFTVKSRFSEFECDI